MRRFFYILAFVVLIGFLVIVLIKQGIFPYADAPGGAPIDLSALSGDSQVTLNWQPSSPVRTESYRVYRSNSRTGTYKLISPDTITEKTYIDRTVTNGKTYWYKVRAARRVRVSSRNQQGYIELSKATAPVKATPGKTSEGSFSVATPPARLNEVTYTKSKTLYVASTGNDSADCLSAATACRQISRALILVTSNALISVGAGLYTGFRLDSAKRDIVVWSPNRDSEIVSEVDNAIRLDETNDITIDGFKVAGAKKRGIFTTRSDRVTLRNNVITGSGSTAILAGLSDDLLIEDNTTAESRSEHGIYVSESSDRPVIRNNTTYDNTKSGIQVNAEKGEDEGDGKTVGAVIEGNYVFNNGNGLNLLGVQYSHVYNNLIVNNIHTGIANGKVAAAEGPKGMRIYHNTVVMAPVGRYAIQFWQTERVRQPADVNMVRNNIFYHPQGKGMELIDVETGAISSDYNIYEQKSNARESNGLKVSSLASLFATPANFEQPSGQKKIADFDLVSSSVAIDKGETFETIQEINAVLGKDILGRTRPQGKPDIGAFELR